MTGFGCEDQGDSGGIILGTTDSSTMDIADGPSSNKGSFST